MRITGSAHQKQSGEIIPYRAVAASRPPRFACVSRATDWGTVKRSNNGLITSLNMHVCPGTWIAYHVHHHYFRSFLLPFAESVIFLPPSLRVIATQ